ncbi:MAG: NAD-dependent deacylase [Emcibacteraceae bacterium]
MMIISASTPIVVLTGAGISQESGLPTFRGRGGLWNGYRAEDLATPDAFRRDPALVHEFYNMRRATLLDEKIKPNAAHLALTRLERDWPGGFWLVTQNVDNLHVRAGSEKLIHMHGELLKSRCQNCGEISDWLDEMSLESECPNCKTRGQMRVNVVWFGEMPMRMDDIYRYLRRCGLFISIGTSGNVYPAAGFTQVVNENPGAKTVELNLEPSLNADQFSDGHYGPASQIVPEFIDWLLNGG